MDRETEQKRGFFDALAAEWQERGFPGDEAEKVLRLKERLGDLEGLAVFEPGCGAGRLTQLLARWVGPSGLVIAVDSSERMIASARAAIAEAGSRSEPGFGRIELVHGDALGLPEEYGRFDLALLFCVFPHFRDPGEALRRFAQRLRPGGRLVISHLEGSESLNAFHQEAGEPVRRDRIPPRAVMEAMVASAGLRLRAFIDTEEEYYLEAVRGTEA